MNLATVRNELRDIRNFMSNCCVATVFYNISDEDIRNFYKWYYFMGIKNIYVLDNGSDKPVTLQSVNLSALGCSSRVVIRQEKKPFSYSLRRLWKWVKENAPEKYVISCDPDELLFIDNPSVLSVIDEGLPLALSWKVFYEDFPVNPAHEVHPAFAHINSMRHPAAKTLCEVEMLNITARMHFPFDCTQRVSLADGRETSIEAYQSTRNKGKILWTRPKNPTWENAWFLHFKIRSREDFFRKSHDTEWWWYKEKHMLERFINQRASLGEFDFTHLKWMEVMRREHGTT